ncbi:SDR family NAD(P)-dependent oxidoreductase, partial [Rhodococcus sp. 7Tela_A2]|uniref:SDR family NAD(P)-dependent oxidoreductase n=1 Tax=Rhodococcus sp. 7Tela_A2 TaxID=3093744 RepID=UPI003BB5BD99
MFFDNPADFTGRAVLVTGGTKGIGYVIAETFLAAGADVLVCGRTAYDTLPTVDSRSAAFTAADIRDAGQAKSLGGR